MHRSWRGRAASPPRIDESPPWSATDYALSMMLSLLLLTGCDQPPVGPPNLILISIDGLRADHLGIHGRDPSPTPTLDALAEDGLVFSQSFSQGNESLYSHASMFTGRHVSEIAAAPRRCLLLLLRSLLSSSFLSGVFRSR